jgi:cytochrome c biogenesis protein CcmG/thiol:disulfide interchange protein DsbE
MTIRGLTLAALMLGAMAGAPVWAADETVDLDAFKGKVLYLDFWASWCAPCRQSFPWMNRLERELGNDGLVVVAVNVDRERADAEQFLRAHRAEFRIVYDPQGKLPEKFGVRGMPTSFVIDRDGRVRFQHQGFFLKDSNTLAQQVRAVVLAPH